MIDRPSSRLSRRTFVVQVGAAATVLGAGVPARGQGGSPATPAPAAPAAPAPAASLVAGKEKLIVRSPRPLNLETPWSTWAPTSPPPSCSSCGTTTTAR